MNKKAVAFCALLPLLITALYPPVTCAGETIVDYYKTIPSQYLGNNRYTLRPKGASWVTTSCVDYEITPVVDLKNGYLAISDEGTGGGTLVHELALFRTGGGSEIVGVCLSQFDGVCDTCKLRFYRPAADGWKDVTQEVLPGIDLALFMDEGYYSKHGGKLDRACENQVTYLFKLPRFGTTAKARIFLERLIIANTKTDERTGKDRLTTGAREMAANLRYQEVKLAWDKKSGRFIIGEKTPFKPSERLSELLGDK